MEATYQRSFSDSSQTETFPLDSSNPHQQIHQPVSRENHPSKRQNDLSLISRSQQAALRHYQELNLKQLPKPITDGIAAGGVTSGAQNG